jgi:hypothetical protein
MPIENEILDGLTAELDVLLEDHPEEADSISLYLESPERYAGRAEEALAGGPGGGVAVLLGPFFLKWMSFIAMGYLAEVNKLVVGEAAKKTVEWLKRLMGRGTPRPALPEVDVMTETISAITTSLIKAGWPAQKAGAAAERVWQSGRSIGRRVAEVN